MNRHERRQAAKSQQFEKARQSMEMAQPPNKMPPHKSEAVDVESQEELWCTYRLKDGTVIKARVTLFGFRRTTLFNEDDTPLYTFQQPQLQIFTDPPESLRKKAVTDLD